MDIKINRNNTDVYYKVTHPGQYIDFTSQTPWRLKTSWIKALYHRAKNICSNKKKFAKQVANLKLFMSWNGYPSVIRNSIIKNLKNYRNRMDSINEEDNRKIIWMRFPYLGKRGEALLFSLKREIKRCLNEDVKFITSYKTHKLSMFCSTKDKIKTLQKSSIIYKIECPACKEHYVGKTDRCFVTRLDEHGCRSDQPMYQHLNNCSKFLEEVTLLNFPMSNVSTPDVDIKLHIMNTVHQNATILEYNENWSQLRFLEAFYIKTLKPKINDGLKASHKMELFK